MKMVYICSPLRGDIEANIKRATHYCEYAAGCGVIPIAPHVAWNGIFDDTIPEKREMALQLGLELLRRCDEVWVMGDEISQGMRGEIEEAERLRMPVNYVLDKTIESNFKLRQELSPLRERDAIPGSTDTDYTGKILVLDSVSLMKRFQNAENSLWIATHGAGCIPGKHDRTVHVVDLYSGRSGAFGRYGFHGVVKPEILLEWLKNHPVRNEHVDMLTAVIPQKAFDFPYVNAYQKDVCEQIYPSAENIASYIAQKGLYGDITITDPLDRHLLDTYGQYLNKCSDKEFMEEHLLPVLVPMQTGTATPPPIRFAEPQDLEQFDPENDEELSDNEISGDER